MSRNAVQKVVDASEKHSKAIEKFRTAYAEAIRAARVAADHTDTDGWQAIYANRIDTYKKEREQIAVELKPMVERLERHGWDEGDEKAVGDLKKRAVESREVHDAFLLTAVSPIRDAVDACNKIVADARYEAQREEEMNPLIAKGLLEAMTDAIAETLAVTFDEKTGRVLLKSRR